ncbi:MAG TPA: FimB/Mfa2 family fimbrial subunit [Candidatus Coprenecus stercoravium]|uniref:FimB/Mfa2 family fimbrial subunit n=1 Tax=Candidatus Coprenecus stercoravium TaxID=2840735 RepID=A0A9D2KAH7_9BACT|nr:FimB/Mfa2 family fimbrial subunit [Candidatus Coprenecus stercoravium]
MTRARQILLIPVLLLLLGATACIRENIDDCETPVTLEFMYFGDGPVDVFSDRIQSVELFVYSDKGELVQTVSCPQEALASNQGAQLRLLEGSYRIVCWGNVLDNTHIEAEAETPHIGEASWFEGSSCSGIDPLYFGETSITVPRTLRPVRDTVIYTCAHISISVNLLGFADASNFTTASRSAAANGQDSAIVTLVHEDLSAHIDFHNTPSETLTDYTPDLIGHPEKEDSYLATYRVPRFTNSTTSQLVLYHNDTGAELFRRPLADILEGLGIDVESRDELNIELNIHVWNSNGEVHIQVVGWDTEIVFPVM